MVKFQKQPQEMPVQKNLIQKRDFRYSKGTVNLNFILALDKNEIGDFRECMIEAMKDIDLALEEIKKGEAK